MILPFLALFFLLIDTCYAIFVKATIQYAVQAGVNDAITFNGSGLLADVQNTVATQSLNLVGGTGSVGTLTISFYAPPSRNNAGVSFVGSGNSVPGANQVGNIVQIDASYPFYPVAPLFRSHAVINFTASSASVLAVFPPPSL